MSQDDRFRMRMPDPTKRCGALFYAVTGGLTTAGVLAVLHHVHLIWS